MEVVLGMYLCCVLCFSSRIMFSGVDSHLSFGRNNSNPIMEEEIPTALYFFADDR